jgi:hypothetical protein
MGSGGGKGGGSKGGSGFGGLSGFDLGAIQQAFGMGTEEISNRYHQLGLGVPDPNVFGGDPATAAKAGGSLTYGSPGTAEMGDVSGLGQVAQAALGQLQIGNQQNPAIAGTPANQVFQNQQAGQFAQGVNTLANQGGNVNTTPSVSTG